MELRSSKDNGAETALSPCGLIVRRDDHDRYLTVLFAPARAREDLFALYAFNQEIAKIRDLVSEPMLGRIRLQWWRETIEAIYRDSPPAHEVARPLAAAIRSHGLPRGPFDRMINAREQDLSGEQPEDLASLSAYAAATGGTLTRLAVGSLGEGAANNLECADAIGTGWALTGILRSIAHRARRKATLLPRELTQKHAVDLGRLLELKFAPGLDQALAAIAAEARAHLSRGRTLRPSTDRKARSPLLVAALADIYLAQLAHAGWDPFAPAIAERPPWLVWRLAAFYAFGRF